MPDPFGPMIAWVSPLADGQVDALEDLLGAVLGVDGDVQVADLQRCHVCLFLRFVFGRVVQVSR